MTSTTQLNIATQVSHYLYEHRKCAGCSTPLGACQFLVRAFPGTLALLNIDMHRNEVTMDFTDGSLIRLMVGSWIAGEPTIGQVQDCRA